MESGRRFNINQLRLRPNAVLSATWRYASGLIVTIEARTAEQYGSVVFRFDGQEQWFELDSLERHFGGRQWFIRCPRTGCRVSTLWMPPGARLFASRQAWGPRRVCYATQLQDRCGRAWATLRRVARRLGDPDSSDLPDRPKGMHRTTYERLVGRFDDAESVIDEETAFTAFRLLQRYGAAAF